MKPLFTLFLLLSFISAKAQDTIFKRNGDKVIARVIEITPSEIKYKRFDFQDGPLYSDSKATIDCIKYSTGLKECFEIPVAPRTNPNLQPFNPLSVTGKITILGGGHYSNSQTGRGIGFNQVQKVLMSTNDRKIMGLVVEAKQSFKGSFVAFGFIPFAIAAGYCALAANTYTYNYSTGTSTRNPDSQMYTSVGVGFGVLALACPVVGFTLRSKVVNSTNEAVRLYNQKY